MDKDLEKEINFYENFISSKISTLQSAFKFVYHIRHPFQINTEGPSEIYNSRLEFEIFEYRLDNLILKYFNTTEGFSDAILISDKQLLDKVVKENFKLSNSKEWYGIERNGKILTTKDHPEFCKEFHKLASSYYEKDDLSDYYSDDSAYHETTWKWSELLWRDLIEKYSMEMDKPVRFSSFKKWFYDNGTPKNLKYPKEYLSPEVLNVIKEEVKDEGLKIITEHDANATLIGSNKNLKDILKKLELEYDLE